MSKFRMTACAETKECRDAPRRVARFRTAIFVIAALCVAVFPYGWLGLVYRPFGNWMDAHFWAETSHHILHSIDFACVSFVLLLAFPGLRLRFSLFIASILGVAAIQEGLQLLYKQRLVAWNDGKDVVVDVVAASCVLVLVRIALWAGASHSDRR